MRSMEFSGRNIDEAIFHGLNEMGLTIDEVDTEIVQKESKGLFGIGAKNAIVRLTEREVPIVPDFEAEKAAAHERKNDRPKRSEERRDRGEKRGDKRGDKRERGEKRERAEKQPLDLPSAGSTFKRPEGYYAAALIDQCGLKGYSIGGARVSEKHAGFLVNTGTSSRDFLNLMKKVQAIVEERAGVRLEPEIRITGTEE